MSFETIIRGKVLDADGHPVTGDVVGLSLINEKNEITNYRNTTLLQNATTDSGGCIAFSGVHPAEYDITVTHLTQNYTLTNYVVKNSFMVPEGGTDFLAESRRYVTSLQSVSGAGILVNDEPLRKFEQHLGYPSDPIPSGMVTTSGMASNAYAFEDIIGTIHSGTTQMAKEFGDRYYASNQNTQFYQNFTIKLPFVM